MISYVKSNSSDRAKQVKHCNRIVKYKHSSVKIFEIPFLSFQVEETYLCRIKIKYDTFVTFKMYAPHTR